MAVGAVFLVLACSLGLVLSVPTKRWSSTVRVRSVILEAPPHSHGDGRWIESNQYGRRLGKLHRLWRGGSGL